MDIPLRNRDGEIVAYAVIDDGDKGVVEAHRWHRTAYGYAARSKWKPTRGLYWMHREILGLSPMFGGREPVVDHVNGNKLDNRRGNLRLASHRENMRNSAPRNPPKSGHRNVYWYPAGGTWRAQVMTDGIVRCRYFHTLEEAAAAAEVMRHEMHGVFAARP